MLLLGVYESTNLTAFVHCGLTVSVNHAKFTCVFMGCRYSGVSTVVQFLYIATAAATAAATATFTAFSVVDISFTLSQKQSFTPPTAPSFCSAAGRGVWVDARILVHLPCPDPACHCSTRLLPHLPFLSS